MVAIASIRRPKAVPRLPVFSASLPITFSKVGASAADIDHEPKFHPSLRCAYTVHGSTIRALRLQITTYQLLVQTAEAVQNSAASAQEA